MCLTSNLLQCIVFFNYMSFAAGVPLRTMEMDLRRYFNQLREIKNHQGATNLRTLGQAVSNLLGMSDDPCVLAGNVIPDLEAFMDGIDVETGKCLVFYVQSLLYAIFCDFERGAELALANDGRFAKQVRSVGFNCLCRYALTR